VIRVVIYARVSTQEQADEGTSLEHQCEQLRTYCQAQKWQVMGTYVDPGHTGKNADRDGLKNLMSGAKLGLFQKVVVYKLDRLARKLRLLLELEENLKDSGIYLYSLKDQVDTSTAIGRTVFQVLGLVSEWERETIIERTKTGRINRFKAGCWGGGKCLYGYSYNPNTKKLIINEAEAAVVRRIFNEYNAGKSMARIADILNAERIPSRYSTAKGWRMSAIRDILVHPGYKGTQYVNHHLHSSKLSDVKPPGAIEISIPKIVTDELWYGAQEHRRNNRHVQTFPSGSRLLQGLVKCGICGYYFRSISTRNQKTYECRGRLKYVHIDGSPRCTAPIINAEWLEEEVWQKIESILNDPNKLEPLLKDTIEKLQAREKELSVRIRPINDQLLEIQERKARLMEDYVVRNMDPGKFKEYQRSLQEEEDRLTSMQAEVDPAQIEELQKTKGLLEFWQTQIDAMAWNTEDEDGQRVRIVDMPHLNVLRIVGLDDKDMNLDFPTTRRQLLDLLQTRLTVFEDRVEVKAIFPIEPIAHQLCTSTCESTQLTPLRHRLCTST
jgi:site-specific DNA recombinase